jgi:hypothetical protein
MHRDDFIGTATLKKLITNRKFTIEKFNFPFLFHIREKFDIDAPVHVIDIEKRTCGQSLSSFSAHSVSLWPEGKAITALKKNYLLSLMIFIPDDAKPFCRSGNATHNCNKC